jgi:hypothetical protein
MRRGISGFLTLVGMLVLATPGTGAAAPLPAVLSTPSGDRLVQLDRNDLRALPGARRLPRGMTAAAVAADGRAALLLQDGALVQHVGLDPPRLGAVTRLGEASSAFGVAGIAWPSPRRAIAIVVDDPEGDAVANALAVVSFDPVAGRVLARRPIPIALDGFGVDAIGNRLVVSTSRGNATVWTVIGASGTVERTIRLPAAAASAPAFFRGRSALAVVVPERGPLLVVDLASGLVRRVHRPDLAPPRRGAAGAQPAQAAWIDGETFVLVGIAAIEDGVARTGAWIVHARSGWLHGTGAGGTLANGDGGVALVYGYARYRLAPMTPKPADVAGAGLAVIDRRGRLVWQGRTPQLADVYVAAGRAYVTGEIEGKPGDVLDLASGRRVGAWQLPSGSYLEWLGPRLRTSVRVLSPPPATATAGPQP